MKKNNLPFGILLGAFAPVIGMLAFYFSKFYPTFSAGDFLKIVFTEKTLISGIAVFSMFVNIALLTYYFNKRLDETAKGIFGITFLYALTALVAKFFI